MQTKVKCTYDLLSAFPLLIIVNQIKASMVVENLKLGEHVCFSYFCNNIYDYNYILLAPTVVANTHNCYHYFHCKCTISLTLNLLTIKIINNIIYIKHYCRFVFYPISLLCTPVHPHSFQHLQCTMIYSMDTRGGGVCFSMQKRQSNQRACSCCKD